MGYFVYFELFRRKIRRQKVRGDLFSVSLCKQRIHRQHPEHQQVQRVDRIERQLERGALPALVQQDRNDRGRRREKELKAKT